jgi:hypothetical protein
MQYLCGVMHDIEPHFQWRSVYMAETDKRSPFFGRRYNEFGFDHQLYNFYLHPQWDEFGSSTLYGKLLFVDYDEQFAMIELIGEWNDVLHNDIMLLRRHLSDPLMEEGIVKFVFFCEHVLNFHADRELDYYEEWVEELREEAGWIALINTRTHVQEELEEAHLDRFLHFGEDFNELVWRTQKPLLVFQIIEGLVTGDVKRLGTAD